VKRYDMASWARGRYWYGIAIPYIETERAGF